MAIVNGYATLNEVKAAARIGTADTMDDSMLEMATETASRIIDGYCERRFFTAGTEVRFYTPESSYICNVDDIAGTAITIETSSGIDGIYDETWTTADYQAEPLNRTASGLAFPITRFRAINDYLFPTDYQKETAVRVTAVFGFATAVPTQIRQATVLLALRNFSRLQSPLGVAGFGDMGAVRVSRVDPDVMSILMPFRKQSPGVA
jgi:hypothetical protein